MDLHVIIQEVKRYFKLIDINEVTVHQRGGLEAWTREVSTPLNHS